MYMGRLTSAFTSYDHFRQCVTFTRRINENCWQIFRTDVISLWTEFKMNLNIGDNPSPAYMIVGHAHPYFIGQQF